MKEESRLTFPRGVIIIIAFALLVFFCINVVIQGESDLTGLNHNLRTISIAQTGDGEFRIYVFGSIYYFQVPKVFQEAWRRAGNVICDLVYEMAASMRQSIRNLNNHSLP